MELPDRPSASTSDAGLLVLLPRVAALLVLVLAAAGIGYEATGAGALELFDLDREQALAAVVSGGLLVAAGLTITYAHRVLGAGWPHYGLPLLLVFMAADEVAFLHERLETRTGVDWQLLYAPLILAGGLAWLVVLRRWGLRSPAGWALLGGAAAWAVSQVLENLAWDGQDQPVAAYEVLMVVEELLEATGSSAFLLAGVLAVRAGRATAGSAGTASSARPAPPG